MLTGSGIGRAIGFDVVVGAAADYQHTVSVRASDASIAFVCFRHRLRICMDFDADHLPQPRCCPVSSSYVEHCKGLFGHR